MENEIPRRNRLDLNTPAEKAIYNAMIEVEKAGSDPKLTEVSEMLKKAKDLLSDYVDSNMPHEVSLVKCDLCGKVWTAVRPEGLVKLECPCCGRISYFDNK